TDRRGVMQSAYQIQVAATVDDLVSARRLLWDSQKTTSDDSVNRSYEGPELKSGQRYFWRIRVWDEKGVASAWSESAHWEMGLLQPSDWQASWIEPDSNEDTSKSQPSPMLRGTFTLKGPIRRARAYVTSHGLYELHLNGQRVGEQVFTPG